MRNCRVVDGRLEFWDGNTLEASIDAGWLKSAAWPIPAGAPLHFDITAVTHCGHCGVPVDDPASHVCRPWNCFCGQGPGVWCPLHNPAAPLVGLSPFELPVTSSTVRCPLAPACYKPAGHAPPCEPWGGGEFAPGPRCCDDPRCACHINGLRVAENQHLGKLAVFRSEQDWPCHQLPKEKWCDHSGPGGFMGHTCGPPLSLLKKITEAQPPKSARKWLTPVQLLSLAEPLYLVVFFVLGFMLALGGLQAAETIAK